MTIADDFIGQRQRRIDKVKKLRELGINPFPAQSTKDYANKHILDNFSQLNGKDASLTGRVITFRDHGKILFADIQDESGTIQLFISKDALKEDLPNGFLGWSQRNLIDTGDHVEAYGTIGKTSTGQESLLVTHLRIISKTIRPLPNSFDDKEQQFRRRYLDLTINPERKQTFIRKAKFWQKSRQFMVDHGFIEVEVPVLEHVTGGADARPFVTYHNDLDQEFYLRISTELYQKRLIGGGFEKIFTLGPNFRNEGISDEHLQEYTQLEWYWAYADYRDNMKLVQELITYVAKEVYGTTQFSTRGHSFDLADAWEEIDYAQTIQETHDIDIFTASDAEMITKLEALGVELPGEVNRLRLIDNLWKTIRKGISGPAFLVNVPKFISPLAKSKPENLELTERFQIIIGGSELGNGYSEINDPEDQLNRFLDQQGMRDSGDDEAQMLDIDYVEMLEYGMPPTSGYGQSERVFWFLENVTAREGTFFPQLKHEVDPLSKKVYSEILATHNISLGKPPTPSKQMSQQVELKLTREKAFEIVDQNIENKNLVKHCLAVEAAMRGLAKYFGEDVEIWGLAGLLHDADWEQTADNVEEHTQKTTQWIQEAGEDNDVLLRAIQAHNYKVNQIEPKTRMEWSLYTCDELTGLITATALMQPNKRLEEVELKSVKKKFKNKKFAAAIDRDQIALCEEKLGIPLDEFMTLILESMKAEADRLGL
ncbi:MAG: lysine--tRNA ligase [Patescibacteria group bacterium]